MAEELSPANRYRRSASAADRRRRKRALIRKYGEQCAECGATENLTLDHIVPATLGGRNDLSNLQLLCQPCNQRKGASG